MKNVFWYFTGLMFILSAGYVLSVDAASVNPNAAEEAEIIPFNQLVDYQILLTGNENGIATYSGVKKDIRLSFMADDKEINKMIVAFDYGTSSSKENMVEIIDVADILFPNKISDKDKAANLLDEKLSDMNSARDEDVFNVEQLKFEAHMNNGMLNLRITK